MSTRKTAVRLGLGMATIAIAVMALGHGCTRSGPRRLRLLTNAGQPTETIGTYDSLMVSLEGRLEPRTHYDFRVTPAGEDRPVVGQARLTTDQEGILLDAILLFDVGQGGVPPGIYDVEVSGPNLEESATIKIERPTDQYVYSCDTAGAVKNSFVITDIAYAAGGNFAPNAEYQLLVSFDRPQYTDGDILEGAFGLSPLGGPGSTSTDGDGNIQPTQIMNVFMYAMPGDGFDVVVDFAPFGEFNAGQDAVDGHAVVGLTYQSQDVGTDVDSELACDRSGIYTDTFHTIDDVYAWINPPLQYLDLIPMVDKYVCQHRDEWKEGDSLQDVSGGGETDGVQAGCTNEQIVVVFPGPLPAGEYDVIIDMNQDGLYTQGTDIVDGGSAESFGKIGFTVE